MDEELLATELGGPDDPGFMAAARARLRAPDIGRLLRILTGGRSLPDIPWQATPLGVAEPIGTAMDAYELVDATLEDDPVGQGLSLASLVAFGFPSLATGRRGVQAARNVLPEVARVGDAGHARASEFLGGVSQATDLGEPRLLERIVSEMEGSGTGASPLLERIVAREGRTGSTAS